MQFYGGDPVKMPPQLAEDLCSNNSSSNKRSRGLAKIKTKHFKHTTTNILATFHDFFSLELSSCFSIYNHNLTFDIIEHNRR